jgi:predicted PurR-regulated permease PerM
MINSERHPDAIFRYLVIGSLVIMLLYFGKALFVPLFYGLFVAIVLYPICLWLEQHRFSRSMAIGLGLLLVMILFLTLLWIVVLQFNAFRQDLPELQAKVEPAIKELQDGIFAKLNISIAAQNEWWQQTIEKISDNSGGILAGTLNKTASSLFMLFIIPVFAALFLYNRNDFILFLEKIAGINYHDRLHQMLHQTIHTYFHFIKGMALVYIVVGVLNSIGCWP